MYIPTKHVNYPQENIDHEAVWELVLKAIQDRIVVVFNWKFEGYILKSKGIYRKSNLKQLHDVMVYRWLYDSDKRQFNLKEAADELLGVDMLRIHEVPGIHLGKKKKEINFALSDPRDATIYAAADPVFTLGVMEICKPVVDKEQSFIIELEHSLLDAIFAMETSSTARS